MADPKGHISNCQAERAIYLDFEGFTGKPPALAGVCIENELQQIVVDPALRSAAEAKNLKSRRLCDLVRSLINECEQNNRVIIAFSTHEMSVIQLHCGIDVSRHYKNGLKIAKRWKWHFHKDIELERNSLDQFLKLPSIGYQIPKHLGKGIATKRLKAVIDGLSKRPEYSELTPTQKAKWTKLLDYNRHDVIGLQELMVRAARDLN